MGSPWSKAASACLSEGNPKEGLTIANPAEESR